mgnify:CR=1 FL=1
MRSKSALVGFLLPMMALAADSPDSTKAARAWRPPAIAADSAFSRPELDLRTLPLYSEVANEELVFAVRFGFITAGEARLHTEKGPDYNGRPTWRVVGTGRSTGAFDWVFRVRDHYESHVDQAGLFPHHFTRSVREGGYRMEREITFDPARRTAMTEDKEKGTTRHQVLPAYCQDLVSAFHYARNLPLDTVPYGGLVEITTFLDGKVHTLRARKTGREQVEVRAGKFDCWVFQPVVLKGRIWKDEADLTIHVSADARRTPVLIKSDLTVGSIRLELIEQQGSPIAVRPQ